MIESSAQVTRIELKLNTVQQLFNSLDPSPFHEKDLDREAEAYIVDWVLESPRENRLMLVLHLPRAACDPEQERSLTESIHNYFGYRVDVTARHLRLMFEQGRLALVIGLLFLATCLLAQHFIANLGLNSLFWSFLEQGLLIGGWVAMWKPIDIFLYQWWPIRRRRRTFERLATMPIKLQPRD